MSGCKLLSRTGRRAGGMLLASVFSFSFIGASAAQIPRAVPSLPGDAQVRLPDGLHATVSAIGTTRITSKDGRVAVGRIPLIAKTSPASLGGGLEDKDRLAQQITQAMTAHEDYVDGRVIVVFKSGIGPHGSSVVPQQRLSAMRASKSAAQRAALAPAYTSDGSTNRILATFGVDRMDRLFQHAAPLRASSQLLDLSSAYRVHLTAARVNTAVAALLKSPAVQYASPDWRVSSMHTEAFPIPKAIVDASARTSSAMPSHYGHRTMTLGATSALPTNFMLTSSGQSLLNARGATFRKKPLRVAKSTTSKIYLTCDIHAVWCHGVHESEICEYGRA